MKNIIWVISTVLIFVHGENDDLILLSDTNFEHLTQAATGATTGDWLVLMMGQSECAECKRIETVLQDVSKDLQGRLNVAKIDPENSALTIRRFKIGKKPAIMFFRLGYQWQYDRYVGVKDLVSFVTEGFQRQNARPVYKPLDQLDVWYEDYVKEMKASYKEKRLPERNALLVTLVGGLLGLLVLMCVLRSKKKGNGVVGTKNAKQSKKRK